MSPALPRLLLLTDRTQCDSSLLDTLAVAVGAGARAVVLREKDLPDGARAELARRIGELLAPVGGVLVVAGTGVHAVHLAAVDPVPEPRPALVGRSCHSAEEVARAAGDACDYVTVSPVFESPSKPGYGPTLGLTGLRDLARHAPPAYALGGVRPDDVEDCLAAGAAGVAVMGTLMREPALAGAYLSRMVQAQL